MRRSGKNVRRLCALLWCSLFLSAACSSYPTYYRYSFDREQARKVTAVVVAPLNLLSPLPSLVRDRSGRVHDSLAASLSAHGVRVEPGANDITAVFEEEKRKAGGIYNAQDGTLDRDRLSVVLRNTVKKLCNVYSVDAVVIPEIVARKATLEGNIMHWDGVVRPIEYQDRSELSFNARPFNTFNGSSTGLSLMVFIVDRTGRQVLRNVAGIESPHKVAWEGKEIKFVPRKDMLANTASIREAVAISLHPFIVYSEYPSHPNFSVTGGRGRQAGTGMR